MGLDGTSSISLQRQGVWGYLIVAASDAMAIKARLQCFPSSNGIVGSIKPNVLWLDEIQDLTMKIESEIVSHLRTCQFNSQALEIHVTSIDDKVSHSVAVFIVEPKVVGKRYIT